MQSHKVEVIIKNHTTGEEVGIVRGDEEYAILDVLKPAFDELLAQYRQRYPVGLRLFKNVN